MAVAFNEVNEILNYLGDLPGVIAALIVSRDGFIIESHVSTNINLDVFGAAVASTFAAEEGSGTDVQLGYLNYSILEYEFGKILTAACGENILAVITQSDAIIGNIRHQIRKFVAELGKLAYSPQAEKG